jgi:hypothetical protein
MGRCVWGARCVYAGDGLSNHKENSAITRSEDGDEDGAQMAVLECSVFHHWSGCVHAGAICGVRWRAMVLDEWPEDCSIGPCRTARDGGLYGHVIAAYLERELVGHEAGNKGAVRSHICLNGLA